MAAALASAVAVPRKLRLDNMVFSFRNSAALLRPLFGDGISLLNSNSPSPMLRLASLNHFSSATDDPRQARLSVNLICSIQFVAAFACVIEGRFC
jgi:hypothetical protein